MNVEAIKLIMPEGVTFRAPAWLATARAREALALVQARPARSVAGIERFGFQRA